MNRLSHAGFKKEFVHSAILPDWWEENCAKDPSLLQDIEIRVARFLDLPLAAIRDAATVLAPPAYPDAQLRKVRAMDRDRLAPAIHSALRIAAAVVRSLRDSVPDPVVPPPDGLAWRDQIKHAQPTATLDGILDDLWLRGIPVVPLDVLPSPSFQGIACIVDGRPIILLGHKHDEPGRVAFLVVHEAGHIAADDCAPGQPVVDKEDEVIDDSKIERRADRYATRMLVGSDDSPMVEAANEFKELANRAAALESDTGADASFLIFAWAARTGDYAQAFMAVKALYRGVGARRKLQQHFAQHVDFDAASESDRALLRCVHEDPERDEDTP